MFIPELWSLFRHSITNLRNNVIDHHLPPAFVCIDKLSSRKMDQILKLKFIWYDRCYLAVSLELHFAVECSLFRSKIFPSTECRQRKETNHEYCNSCALFWRAIKYTSKPSFCFEERSANDRFHSIFDRPGTNSLNIWSATRKSLNSGPEFIQNIDSRMKMRKLFIFGQSDLINLFNRFAESRRNHFNPFRDSKRQFQFSTFSIILTNPLFLVSESQGRKSKIGGIMKYELPEPSMATSKRWNSRTIKIWSWSSFWSKTPEFWHSQVAGLEWD
jgi:hypothetical protein